MDEFVVIGEWKDQSYMDLWQEATRRTISNEERKRLIAGPRRHPFGAEACEVNIDGQWVVFPSREAAGV